MHDPSPPSASDRIVSHIVAARRVLVPLLAVVDPATALAKASRLIDDLGSLAAIGVASRRRLASLAGDAVADLLVAHRAAMLATLREPAVEGAMLASRCELAEYLRWCMAADRREQLRVFFLDPRGALIAEEVIARGKPDSIDVAPRHLLVRALDLDATGLIVVHNHPSGDPEPSAADRRFTRRLATAAATLDIRLVDHLVVARGGVRSAWSRDAADDPFNSA